MLVRIEPLSSFIAAPGFLVLLGATTILTRGDIQMSFVGEAAHGLRAGYPQMNTSVRRLQKRPTYRRALERGGSCSIADLNPLPRSVIVGRSLWDSSNLGDSNRADFQLRLRAGSVPFQSDET